MHQETFESTWKIKSFFKSLRVFCMKIVIFTINFACLKWVISSPYKCECFHYDVHARSASYFNISKCFFPSYPFPYYLFLCIVGWGVNTFTLSPKSNCRRIYDVVKCQKYSNKSHTVPLILGYKTVFLWWAIVKIIANPIVFYRLNPVCSRSVFTIVKLTLLAFAARPERIIWIFLPPSTIVRNTFVIIFVYIRQLVYMGISLLSIE